MRRELKPLVVTFLFASFSACGGNTNSNTDNENRTSECQNLEGMRYTRAEQGSGIIEFLGGDIIYVAGSDFDGGGWLSATCSNGVFTFENDPYKMWSDDSFVTLKVSTSDDQTEFFVYKVHESY